MSMEEFGAVLLIFAALSAFVLGGVMFAKNPSNSIHRGLAAMLGAISLQHVANGLGVLNGEQALWWRHISLVGELVQPAILMYAALTFIGETPPGAKAGARWRAHALLVLGSVFAVYAVHSRVFEEGSLIEGIRSMVVIPIGKVFYVFILLGMAMGLSQLEQILRGTRDPDRYQMKFVLIGLGGLAGYQIYQASHLLLLSYWQFEQAFIGGVIAIPSIGLIAFGFWRTRSNVGSGKIYVSPRILYGSFTFIVVGLYLLVVGIIGPWIGYSSRLFNGILSTAVVFCSIVGLVVLLVSRTVRGKFRRIVASHFYKTKYDYREKWLEIAEAFQTATSVDTILDNLLNLLSRTFSADRIAIWMVYDADGRYHQVRSINPELPPSPLDPVHPLVVVLKQKDRPIGLDEFKPEVLLDHDPLLAGTRAVLFVPIRLGEEEIAFITMSQEHFGGGYETDDCVLLRGISHHVSVLLSHARMAEERTAAAELEALHRFSAFCMHDLKNLAGKLSLVVQNGEIHSDNPVFIESAMRTVASTVEKMKGLINKLSMNRMSGANPELLNVNTMIAETVRALNGQLAVSMKNLEDVSPVLFEREQFQQVLLNLILNAREVGGSDGTIDISTLEIEGKVVILVSDTGPGIPRSRLRTIFKPFQTTKKLGLGIGLYECKQIIETHGGIIRIESLFNKGTCVRIELPVVHAMMQVANQ